MLSNIISIFHYSFSFTGGLWYPLDKIMSGCLIVFFNVMILMLLVMILFNFILNIPINLSFLAGLINFGVGQRNRNFTESLRTQSSITNVFENGDRISGPNLNRLLTIANQAITNTDRRTYSTSSQANASLPLRRSASTGRLTDASKNEFNRIAAGGSGDA